MFEGGILKAGKPEELASDEVVRRVYLGQNFELRRTKIDFEAPKTTIIHGKGELNLTKE